MCNTVNENAALKKQLRKQCITARKALSPEERGAYSAEIRRRIAADACFDKARTILIYKAMPGEVELDFESFPGKIFVYPVCTDNRGLLLLVPGPDTDWIMNSFGIYEPDPSSSTELQPGDIDLVICPCAGFDENCGRLGMGGGYYDRLLPQCGKADIVSAAFECQKLSSVPAEDHDIPVTAVFTEKKIYRK